MVKHKYRKPMRVNEANRIYENALKLMNKENISLRQVARYFGISYVTLLRYYRLLLKHKNPPKLGYHLHKRLFNNRIEKQISKFGQLLAKLYSDIPSKELKKFAFEYAYKNSLTFPKNWDSTFFKRYSSRPIKSFESKSLSHATSFTEINVENYFGNISSVMEKYNFEPHNIYNVDKICINTIHKPFNIPETEENSAFYSQEEGNFIIMCLAVSAVGQIISPTYEFPRVKFYHNSYQNAPVGSNRMEYNLNWLKQQNFVIFLRHFAKYAKPSETSKVLLLLDVNFFDLSIEAVDFCFDNFIILVGFPLHIPHSLQPLELCIFGLFNICFNMFAEQWVLHNPDKRMSIYDLPDIVAQCLPSLSTPDTIKSAFDIAGVYPFKKVNFSEVMFDSEMDAPIPLINKNKTNDKPKNDMNINKNISIQLKDVQPLPEAWQQPSCSSTYSTTNYSRSSTPKVLSAPYDDLHNTKLLSDECEPIVSALNLVINKPVILTDTPEKVNTPVAKYKGISKENNKGKGKLIWKKGKDKADAKLAEEDIALLTDTPIRVNVIAGKLKSTSNQNYKGTCTLQKEMEKVECGMENFCTVCLEPLDESVECFMCTGVTHLECANHLGFEYICLSCMTEQRVK